MHLLNTLKSDQIETRFARIRMIEQQKYLNGKKAVLLKKENQLLNAICSDIFLKHFQINVVHKVEADIKDILATAEQCRNLAYSKRIQQQAPKLQKLNEAKQKIAPKFKEDVSSMIGETSSHHSADITILLYFKLKFYQSYHS